MKERAFTLLELLIVISIIAVLTGIALPVFGAAKVRGQQVSCASNLRQIGIALQAYASENDGNLPETTHTTGVKLENAWIFTLKSFLSNIDRVRICPADPIGEERLKANGTSYVLNSYVFVPKIGPFGQNLGSLNNTRKLPYPARTLVAFNVSDEQGAAATNDHTHGDAWPKNWRRLRGDIEPNRFRASRSNTDHTNGSANYLYLDGHVENLQAKELKRRVDAGELFGKPPVNPEDAP